jgi:hypothetical protein
LHITRDIFIKRWGNRYFSESMDEYEFNIKRRRGEKWERKSEISSYSEYECNSSTVSIHRSESVNKMIYQQVICWDFVQALRFLSLCFSFISKFIANTCFHFIFVIIDHCCWLIIVELMLVVMRWIIESGYMCGLATVRKQNTLLFGFHL